MSNPIFNVRDISLSFGVKPLFSWLSLTIYPGDRICLVGRNGEGKSSLMKVICGTYQVDSGEVWIYPNIEVGYLPQSLDLDNSELNKTVHAFIKESVKIDESVDNSYQVDILVSALKLDPNLLLKELSGGLLRRTLLAKALIKSPDILLLDEPTNHLDIETIEWLEGYIKQYKGAIVIISHDRAFLKNISNKTFWLDRGFVKTHPHGYEKFEEWAITTLEAEQKEIERLGKKLEQEETWKIQGISARRKRNQKRLQNLFSLRTKLEKAKSHRKILLNKIKLDPLTPALSSRLVTEFKGVSKNYGDRKVISNLEYRLMRGDKIGIIGINGAGKTTFLKLLVNDIKPDQGSIRIGKTVTITYYDQTRSAIDYDKTLWETLCPEGGDHIKVGERYMHVVAYLKNFLFDPKQAKDKVATLSGGQINRLLLAKALADPGSLLILDEPTNDLDMDTLDMIKDILYDYQGTLIIVSHDRDFIDSLCAKILYFPGDGEIEEFIGTSVELRERIKRESTPQAPKKASISLKDEGNQQPKNKLTYILKHELETLPNRIEILEEEVGELEEQLSQVSFYEQNPESFIEKSKCLQNKKRELDKMWLRLEELYKISSDR
jgi:ATP-binding cassette subfamily F protein uup